MASYVHSYIPGYRLADNLIVQHLKRLIWGKASQRWVLQYWGYMSKVTTWDGSQ